MIAGTFITREMRALRGAAPDAGIGGFGDTFKNGK
jgi:hypothetical protein